MSAMREKFEFIAVREDERIADDRRRSPRATCKYTAEFVDPGTGRTISGTVTDISQVGMRMRSGGKLRLRQKNNLRFYVWINGTLLKLSGSVVRQSTEGFLGIDFNIGGEILKERLDQTVREAAHRNLRLELRKRIVHEVTPPGQPTVRSISREFMRAGLTLHESLVAAKALQQSVSQKWILRRVATHLDG
jgi:hypothetical protein